MRRVCIAALSAVAMCGLASAADIPAKAPVYKAPVAASYNWTGFYVGAHAGYGWSAGSTGFTGLDPVTNLFPLAQSLGIEPTSLRPHMNGFIGGGQLGYNWQLGQHLVGIETDVSFSGMRGSAALVVPALFGFPPLATTQANKLDWFGTLRGRVGWLYNPATLLYATGGVAYGHATASTLIDEPGNCPGAIFCGPVASKSAMLVGWTVGGGVEAAVGPQWTAKVEYLYFDLGKLSYTDFSAVPLGGFAAGTYPIAQIDAKFSGSIVRVGLNYSFH